MTFLDIFLPILEKVEMEGRSRRGAGGKVAEEEEENDNIEPFRPGKSFYDPRELRSWAKRTGFVSTFSGETERGSVSGRNQNESGKSDLEKGLEKDSLSPTIEIDPILGRTRNRETEIEGSGNAPIRNERERGFQLRDEIMRNENQRNRAGFVPKNEERREGLIGSSNGNSNVTGNETAATVPLTELKREDENVGGELEIPVFPENQDPNYGEWHQSPKMKYGLRENPGFG